MRFAVLPAALVEFDRGDGLDASVRHKGTYLPLWQVDLEVIFIGGAGSAIIGGLYWSRGTTAGAWSAMLVGIAISCSGIAAKQLPDDKVSGDGAMFDLVRWMRDGVTGQELTFWSIAISIGCYVVVSLATSRQPFNMDKLLHRGEYALDGKSHKSTQATSWLERLGFDSEMTRRDRWVTAITLAWPAVFTIVFFAALIAHASGWSPGGAFWASAWKWYTGLALSVAVIIVIWFTIGGLIDLRAMFKKLGSYQASASDDGRVVDHHNADE